MSAYLAHIRNGNEIAFTHAKCGAERKTLEWWFVDLAHAEANKRAGSKLVLCEGCRAVAELGGAK